MKEKLSFLDNDIEKIWLMNDEAFLPKNIVPALKYGGISIMFSSRVIGKLIAIRGIMKSEDYIKMLDKNQQIPTQNLDLARWFTFQQDKDPKHTSKSVTVWLQN